MNQSKPLHSVSTLAAFSGPCSFPIAVSAGSTSNTKLTASAGGSPADASFYERIFRRVLAPMQKGHLVLELPDGRRLEYGRARGKRAARLPGGITESASILVRDAGFFRHCVLAGDIGFAEAFVDGSWETPDLRAVIAWFLLNVDNAPTLSGSARKRARGWLLNVMHLSNRLGHLLRPNSRASSRQNISAHYDLSNQFFALMLDPSMMYSSAKWTGDNQSLEVAQREKNAALCRMLRLQPGDHVLEIGTGWGGWALHAARQHGCRITTLTNSVQQHALAVQRIQQAGLAHRVDVRCMDFRDISGRYDKIVSIEMMEALGHRYLPEFCAVIDSVLKPEGLVALQFITCPDSRYSEFRRGVDFIQKHIFPGSLLLSLNRVNDLLARAGGFVVHEVSDLGQDYSRTLEVWQHNFRRNLDQVRALGMDERFIRKWSYYLDYCGAAFAMRNISVVQTLHTRANNISL
jgi:cyclopropane-fatty-acyl-phospholipid synthase